MSTLSVTESLTKSESKINASILENRSHTGLLSDINSLDNSINKDSRNSSHAST